jgi:hypothetical protein
MNAPYELVEGTVHRASRASRWVAIVELRERAGAIELSVGDTWVLHPGDSVVFLGRQDAQTGKFLAPCYRNVTSGVRGCRSSGGMVVEYLLFAAIAALSFCLGARFSLPILWVPVVVILLRMLFKLDDLMDDLRYSRALRRHAVALALLPVNGGGAL